MNKEIKRKKSNKKSSVSMLPVVGKATLRHVRMSPRKARLVINMIKGKQVEPAMQILKFAPKKGAAFAVKILQSAIANAVEQNSADVDSLWVTRAYVDMGRTLKRYIPAAQGRAVPNNRRYSHVTIELGQK